MWLEDDEVLCLNYDNYVSFTRCRGGTSRGGGAAVFANPALMAQKVEIKLHDNYTGVCDAITLLINPGEHQYFITVVYCPPGLTIDGC